MKRFLAMTLFFALLACGAAYAEEPREITVDVDFEGEWMDAAAQALSLYLPDGWEEIQGDADFTAGAADGSASMVMAISRGSEAYDLDALYEEKKAENASGVELVLLNDFPFVLYTLEEQDVFGALTLSEDEMTAIDFQFTPADEEMRELAMKIVSSMVELDSDALNDDSGWGDGE